MVKLQNQATAALTPAYEELAAQLPTEPVLGIDESPTKQAQVLTDAFDGVVNCDRAKMYWNVGRPQWCWAHLKRDFQALTAGTTRQSVAG